MLHNEIEIHGQKLAYYESNGTGSPILFLHGNSMSGLSFEKQLQSTLGETHRLVALDLPGHGRSAPAHDPRTAYTLPGYAATVAGFAQQLAMENTLFVGWSLGGHVLLEAMRLLPKAAGLMICGTPPIGKPVAAGAFLPNPLFGWAFTSELNDNEIAAVTAGFFKTGSRIPETFIDDIRWTDGRARDALGASVADGTYADEVAVVANFSKPVAIVHGEKDSVVSLSYIESLTIPALWRGAVQIIPEAGHTPQWEQPELFNSLLLEFAQDCLGDIISQQR